MQCGPPPADQDRREQWLSQLDTIAACRERWQVRGGVLDRGKAPLSREQLAHRERAVRAVDNALQIAGEERNAVVIPAAAPFRALAIADRSVGEVST